MLVTVVDYHFMCQLVLHMNKLLHALMCYQIIKVMPIYFKLYCESLYYAALCYVCYKQHKYIVNYSSMHSVLQLALTIYYMSNLSCKPSLLAWSMTSMNVWVYQLMSLQETISCECWCVWEPRVYGLHTNICIICYIKFYKYV